MLGAYVPVALKNPAAHAAGAKAAVKTAKLIAAVATTQSPYLVLADDAGTVELRTKRAGRIRPEDGLSKDEWKIFASGADRIALEVFEETGLRTVFHHHCAGYVETPDEIARLLDMTQPGASGAGVRRRPLRTRNGHRGWRPGRRRSTASRSGSGTST